MNALDERWVVQARDDSGDWYQVGLKYDDPRTAKIAADRLKKNAPKRELRVVPFRDGAP